jgi:hypothetical protein
VWFLLIYLLIEALQKHDHVRGDALPARCGEDSEPATRPAGPPWWPS